MTIGGLVGFGALALAAVAAAIRRRDLSWAGMAVLVVLLAAALSYGDGLQLGYFVANADGLVNVVGAVLGALGLIVLTGLPLTLEDRLLYGPYLPELAFERAVVSARKRFVDASRVLGESLADEANWRGNVKTHPPSPTWASLADRLARSDQEWVEGSRSSPGDAGWLDWKARNDRIGEEWTALRAPRLERGRKRGRVLSVVGWAISVVAIGCIGAGFLGVPSGLASAPPQGRATVVPERPFGHGVTLVPMGGVPEDDLVRLVSFYGARYGLPISVVPATQIPGAAFDPARRQLVGEDLIAVLRSTQPIAVFENQVVIGVVAGDMYLRSRPEWRFGFGVRQGNVAVISTGRMGTSLDLFDRAVERARLRKMITRYIGFMLYDLPESTDRGSVMYQPLLSRDDLDLMGEDY